MYCRYSLLRLLLCMRRTLLDDPYIHSKEVDCYIFFGCYFYLHSTYLLRNKQQFIWPYGSKKEILESVSKCVGILLSYRNQFDFIGKLPILQSIQQGISSTFFYFGKECIFRKNVIFCQWQMKSRLIFWKQISIISFKVSEQF